MTIQLSIELHEKENNRENQSILEANKERFTGQCKVVYQALIRGERLTTTSALLKYGIGDLRRRIKDLIESGVPVKKNLIEGRFKEYYL